MARIGIDAETGQVLRGWAHCRQSITKIIETEIGSRVQRREAGSRIPDRIDDPQNPETIVAIYMDLARAIEPRLVEGHQLGEPGFVLLQAHLDASIPGIVSIFVGGVFFENGHLGDWSNPELQSISLPLPTS